MAILHAAIQGVKLEEPVKKKGAAPKRKKASPKGP